MSKFLEPNFSYKKLGSSVRGLRTAHVNVLLIVNIVSPKNKSEARSK